MNWTGPVLAQADPARELLERQSRGTPPFDFTETVVVLGFLLLLVLALFAWAYFIRRRPTENMGSHVLQRRRAKHRRRHSLFGGSSLTSETARRMRVRRRRRRRTDTSLPRNPTLGETGGLPPPRPEEPEEPSRPLPEA